MGGYDPHLLVSKEFVQQAAILRHQEKQRVGVQNRLYALTEFPAKKDWGMHLPPDNADVMWFDDLLSQVKAREERLVSDLTETYLQSPLAGWSSQFKGLGPGKLMARLLGEIGDPFLQTSGHLKGCEGTKNCLCGEILAAEPRMRTFAQLKSYAGMAPKDGKLPMNIRGTRSAFKGSARVRLWLITDQLVKQHTPPYHTVFTEGIKWYSDETARGVTQAGKPWTDIQFEVMKRKRARVLTGVRFLEDLYDQARELHQS